MWLTIARERLPCGSRASCDAGLIVGMDAVAGLAMVAGLSEERDGGRLGPDCSALGTGGRRGPCLGRRDTQRTTRVALVGRRYRPRSANRALARMTVTLSTFSLETNSITPS